LEKKCGWRGSEASWGKEKRANKGGTSKSANGAKNSKENLDTMESGRKGKCS